MFALLQGMPNWITAFGLGLVGGLLRVAIDRPVVWPHRRTADEGGPGFDSGFVGTLLTAGAASSLLWVPLTSHLFADEGFGRYTIVAAIFVGLGGGDILMTYLSKWFGVSVSQQASQQVNQETSEIAKSLAEAQKSLSQQLSESQQREHLERIQEDAQRVQELAKELEGTRSVRKAQRIRREMAKISRDIEKASRAVRDYDRAMRAAGY